MSEWVTRLRTAGLRVTQPRVAVLTAVAAHPHQTADRVAAQVRAATGTVSTQAVYDTLNTLTTHRLLRRFEPAGSPMRFEIFRGDNHHHLVCRSCGRVEDVPCAVGAMPCAVPADTAGYLVDEAEVTYWGLCPDCLTRDDSGGQVADTDTSPGAATPRDRSTMQTTTRQGDIRHD